MRGEHKTFETFQFVNRGSSPHARGAPLLLLSFSPRHGIIPACAGSTYTFLGMSRYLWDHPRMRGEHSVSDVDMQGLVGSSPHARGARDNLRVVGRGIGIIPACAGSTSSSTGTESSRGDHPRMRGEHRPGRPQSARRPGSSPHARGARWTRSESSRATGIIPACAGSTSRSDR